MKKDVSIENWLIRGTVFILIFTFACFVWFQYRISTIERYDSNYKVDTQHIDEASQNEQNERSYIEINDDVEQDTTGDNSADSVEMDEIESERNPDKS